MAIHYNYKVEDDILWVTTKGKDENKEEVIAYGRELLAIATEKSCTKVFCDERDLEYRLSSIETYEIAESVAREASWIKKIAIVCNGEGKEDGLFFEIVTKNRGLSVYVSTDYNQTLNWFRK